MSRRVEWTKRWPDAPALDPVPAGAGAGDVKSKPIAGNWDSTAATRAPIPVPGRVSAMTDALALLELLRAGTTPVLVDGRVYLQGIVSPKARELFNANSQAIGRLLGAFASGVVDRQALARKLAGIDDWTWPGTADRPAVWPGLDAFLLGVPPVRCADCRRLDGRSCTKYGLIPAPARAVRCLWALPRQPKKL